MLSINIIFVNYVLYLIIKYYIGKYMQNIKIKVSKEFISLVSSSKLSPLRLIPRTGYYFKHHFVLNDIDLDNELLCGSVSTANEDDDSKLTGECDLSIDGEHSIVVFIE